MKKKPPLLPPLTVEIGGYNRRFVFKASSKTRTRDRSLVEGMAHQEVAFQRDLLRAKFRDELSPYGRSHGARSLMDPPPVLVMTDLDYPGQGTVIRVYEPDAASEYWQDMSRIEQQEVPPVAPAAPAKPVKAQKKPKGKL